MKVSKAQRNKIKEMFFARVPDSQRRHRIIQLAHILADEPEDDDFYSALYHYSLEENWDDADKELKRLLPTQGWHMREEMGD